jgi:hypothetical protein
LYGRHRPCNRGGAGRSGRLNLFRLTAPAAGVQPRFGLPPCRR